MFLRVVDGLSVRLFLDRSFREGDARDAVERRDFAVDGARDAQRSAGDLQKEYRQCEIRLQQTSGFVIPEERQSGGQQRLTITGELDFWTR